MNEDLLKELFEYRDGCLYYKISTSNRVKIGDRFGAYEPNGYRRGTINYKPYREHRLVWLFHGLELPEGMQIDHINHNRSDNRIDNLRMVTNEENARNKRRWKSSRPYQGVRELPSGNYAADIITKKEYTYIGTFHTLDEAIAARKAVEVELGFHENHNT